MQIVSIDSLSIENFGPYYGKHEFDFTPVDDKKTILIGGKNGVGKTHLLRALYLAAAGESGRIDLKKLDSSEDASRFTIEESLNRRAAREGENTSRLSVTLTQSDETGTGTRKLTLTREIKHRPNSGPVFNSSALLSGDGSETTDPKKIEKLRDAFLPRHLARFFFFDAERSQSVQLTERDITEGVSRILGLYAYTELEEDLRSLVSNKIPKIYGQGSEAERKLAEQNAEVQRNEGTLKALKTDQEELTQDLKDSIAQLLEIEEELKAIGATDPKHLADLQEKRSDAKGKETQLEAALADSWEFSLPASLLGKYRSELVSYLESEEARRNWEGRKESVEPRIPQVQEDVFSKTSTEYQLNDELLEYYKNRLSTALRRLFDPPPTGMSERVFVTDRNDLSAQIRYRLSVSLAGVKKLQDGFVELETIRADLRDLNQKINQLQQGQAAIQRGNELREKRSALVANQENLQEKIRKNHSEITTLESRVAEIKREESLIRQDVEKIQKGRSLRTQAHKYMEAVSEIRRRATVELREKISEIVGKLWVEITDRGIEWVGMEFDSHWVCSLVRKNGDRVLWDRANPSAGQQQVRVLAFTEALRRLAQYAPPLVVDTPMGRLDKEVRQSVLENLYLSGHQSIILSTNSEIDPQSDQLARIHSKIARVYTLNPHGNTASDDYEAVVTNDYFGAKL